MEVLGGYMLTAKETEACFELIKKMREEKRRIEAIAQNKEYLENVVMSTIDAIGLEETKRIIRDINRNLRRCSDEQPFEEV